MSEPQVEAIIDVAKQLAEAKGITIHDAQCGMALVQIQELLGVVKDLVPPGGDLRDQVRELADVQNGLLGRLGQLQEHVEQLRHGYDGHEAKIQAAADAIQNTINALGEHGKAIAQIVHLLPDG